MARGEANEGNHRLLFAAGVGLFGVVIAGLFYDAFVESASGFVLSGFILPCFLLYMLYRGVRSWPFDFTLDREPRAQDEARLCRSTLPYTTEFEASEHDSAPSPFDCSWEGSAFGTPCPCCTGFMESGVLELSVRDGSLDLYTIGAAGVLTWRADSGESTAQVKSRGTRVPALRCTECGNIMFRMP